MTSPTPTARDFLRNAAIVAGFSVVIGLGLAAVRGGGWAIHMVYAQSIGLSIWAFTDFGRFLFKRDPESNWPIGWRRVALHSGASVAGYLVGTAMGDAYCGCSSVALWSHSPRTSAGYLVMSIGITAGVSFFFLARSRDKMRRRQLAAAQHEATQAKLKLLESQLEPHMLFNTLANLRVLIGIDPPKAQAMLDQLISFLRATLSASRADLHPLSAEFERVDDYLALMKIRMGERLRTRLDLPPELATHPVPPLLLQPLVENAIKHGLEPHVDGGSLRVSAAHDAGQLVLTVRDTGAGLNTPATGGTRFGLTQVSERLATLYGAHATLTLEAAADSEGGTLATLRLPWNPRP